MPITNTVRSSLEVDVPRQTSWHVPRGSYPSLIRSVSLANRLGGYSNTPIVRIVFNPQVPGSQLEYLAKLELKLDLHEGSELWNLLRRLIGRQALQDCSGQKFNLETLVGMACDIEIDHNYDKAETFDFPLVIVTDVQEAGTLTMTGPRVARD